MVLLLAFELSAALVASVACQAAVFAAIAAIFAAIAGCRLLSGEHCDY
jgi:hypothetical protein